MDGMTVPTLPYNSRMAAFLMEAGHSLLGPHTASMPIRLFKPSDPEPWGSTGWACNLDADNVIDFYLAGVFSCTNRMIVGEGPNAASIYST